MANVGFLVPRPSKCTDCKGGTKGMDVCETCKGSGTIFRVNGSIFPDTREGYDAAERALNRYPSPGRALAELVIEEGLEFQKLELSAADAKHIERSREFLSLIAATFRIPVGSESVGVVPGNYVADLIEMLKPR